ncbi:MAG TPA: hypothetical protein VNB94_03900 [Mycobacteriales bacterium]|nr:hypothetical protein [Mycobacteriales bacterium]
MGIFRRRALPAHLESAYEAFLRCAEHVDLGQRAMIRCVPSSARAVGLPLAVGAQTLAMSLDEARAEMPRWHHPDVAGIWADCSAALDETSRAVGRAVEIAAATRELEVALTAVQDLLDPLHAFVDAEARFAELRR